MPQTPEQKKNWNEACLDFINEVYGGWPQCTGCRRDYGDGRCEASRTAFPTKSWSGCGITGNRFPGIGDCGS
jgi:hypothetical protein